MPVIQLVATMLYKLAWTLPVAEIAPSVATTSLSPVRTATMALCSLQEFPQRTSVSSVALFAHVIRTLEWPALVSAAAVLALAALAILAILQFARVQSACPSVAAATVTFSLGRIVMSVPVHSILAASTVRASPTSAPVCPADPAWACAGARLAQELLWPQVKLALAVWALHSSTPSQLSM